MLEAILLAASLAQGSEVCLKAPRSLACETYQRQVQQQQQAEEAKLKKELEAQKELLKAFQNKRLVFKVRIRDAAVGNALQNSIFSPGDADREEWFRLTVDNGNSVSILHSTNIMNKFWGNRTWYDHPTSAIRACKASLFEVDKTSCIISESDKIILPEGSTVYDYSFDVRYEEGGVVSVKSLQLSKDRQPDEIINLTVR
ncbi:hypothetical protein [Synechococcus elongatus]|uniref:Uncharacterized protein n=1 Tax=Synechococcus elongatus PCC 11802 TaxID=2283154 RepID=A0AAT9JSF6_SYNEL|nr:hypothetical protein [Synechococcus elongatus]QFZ92243.1 hypothetical protein EKO22_07610 [Synechococcus elongatus PCC 11802]